jgi:hypothetical protein
MGDKGKKDKLKHEKQHLLAKEKNKKKKSLILESNDLKQVHGGQNQNTTDVDGLG